MCIRICQGQNAPSSLPSLREAGALSVMTALVLGCPSAVILPELAGVSTAREGVLPRSSLFLIHTWPGPCHGPSHYPSNNVGGRY